MKDEYLSEYNSMLLLIFGRNTIYFNDFHYRLMLFNKFVEEQAAAKR